jgi:predicted DNA-binding transcriptional regulator AlpA
MAIYQNELPAHMILCNEHETAQILGKKVSTLRTERVKGGGLPYCKLGRNVRYRMSDIHAHIEAGMRDSTSQGK